MSWSVWQIDRAGRPERVGSYLTGADARRVLRTAVTRGAAVDPEGVIDDGDDRGISTMQCRMIETAAEAWLATATAPTVPAPAAVVEIPAAPEDIEPVSMGAATEVPAPVEASLPVAFEPPVIEPAPRSYAERVEDLRAEIARGRPSADLEHLRVQLAAATSRAAAAEEALAAAAAERRASLDAEQTIIGAALDAESERAARVLAEQQRDVALAAVTLRQSDCDARDRTIAALRADLRGRDRTIANLRAELAAAQHAHPVVRITAPRVRRVVREETPVETLRRRLAEIAEGRR